MSAADMSAGGSSQHYMAPTIPTKPMLNISTTNSHAGAMVARTRNGFGLIVYATQAGGCRKIIDVVTSWNEL